MRNCLRGFQRTLQRTLELLADKFQRGLERFQWETIVVLNKYHIYNGSLPQLSPALSFRKWDVGEEDIQEWEVLVAAIVE